ncbi:phage tail-collar fiber domain-containing protein [Yersinia enterocolitica]
MTTKYFAILTNQGATRLANAAALGTTLKITHMSVGDGGGQAVTPNPEQTTLINEVRRGAVNMLSIDPLNMNQIIVEQVIPENEGGWFIREIGLFDSEGMLIAVANCPETYKPLLQEGSGRTQTIRMILIVSSTNAVELKIDPSVVLATRQYVDNKIIEVKQYADDLHQKHIDAANPHSQYAFKHSPTLTGIPTAPTPDISATGGEVATAEFVKQAISALVDSSPEALDTLNELAEALGNDPNFATTMTNALAGKQPLSAILTSLSGLATTENKLPYFSNKNMMALANLSAVGRVMIGQNSKNEVLEYLGVKKYVADALTDALTDEVQTKAPLDSPALTGTPTAPTPDISATGGEVATAEFVKQAVSALVDSSPEALNTLNELAEALGNDPNFATTMTNALAGKQPLSAILTSLSGLATTENKLPYFSNKNMMALANLSAVGRVMIGQNSKNEVLEYLGVKKYVADTLTDALTDEVQTKAPLDSPALTGTPTAPTPVQDTDDQQIATTEFVHTWVNILESEIRNGLPVGIPLPWPLATPPAGWLVCHGQAFNKAQFPQLAKAYPNGVLPDLRGVFIRGWNNGRNLDSGRTLLSFQGDAIRNITGFYIQNLAGNSYWSGCGGAFYQEGNTFGHHANNSGGNGATTKRFDASRVVPTANENRPVNMAFNYIVRAA